MAEETGKTKKSLEAAAEETVLDYIAAVNAHDIEKIYGLMGEEYRFIDTYCAIVNGRDEMRTGWIGYFEWFPDYKIETEEIFTAEDRIGIFGFASGTYHGEYTEDNRNYWRLPAAWKAVVREGKIVLWQVICDSKIPMDIMSEADRKKVPEVNPELKNGGFL